MWTVNFQMFKLDSEKPEEPEIKLSNLLDYRKSERVQEKYLLLFYWLCQRLWQWTVLKEMEIPDHLTCLLRNLYAGQQAAVRTGHGTTDWFQIGKVVRQGYILSLCLFNLYGGYIIEMPGWMKYKLESRLLGKISITSDMQMTPPLWQKVKKN